jgi:chemotaxis response regulator CheB
MGGTPRTSRVYIVSQTSLFAQGIRSLLQEQPMIEIIGVEDDPIRAMEEVRSLHPDVVIVESSQEENRRLTLDIILQNNTPGRVVAFDLKHNNAIVYNRHQVLSMRTEDLVQTIRGEARP